MASTPATFPVMTEPPEAPGPKRPTGPRPEPARPASRDRPSPPRSVRPASKPGDSAPDSARSGPKPARSAANAGQRDGAAGSSRADGGRSGGRARKKASGRGRPTSARSMAGQPEPERETVEVDEVTFTDGGRTWLARRLGMAGGGSTHRAPLMLTGFWHAGETEGNPLREGLVVGNHLSTLSTEALRSALDKARPWREPVVRDSAESGRARGRSRGRGPGGGRGGAGGSRRT